jgi:hypothetical protein
MQISKQKLNRKLNQDCAFKKNGREAHHDILQDLLDRGGGGEAPPCFFFFSAW